MNEFLNQKATQVVFAELVGVSQQSISKQLDKGVLHSGQTLGEWLIRYCKRLRDEAAGRGGSQQESLAIAKTEEANVKTALNRLAYHEKKDTIILDRDVGYVLNDWAGYANREYKSGIEKIVQSIESEHRVSVDRSMVNNIAGSTTERIQGYASKLGSALVKSGGAVQPAEEYTDSGMVNN